MKKIFFITLNILCSAVLLIWLYKECRDSHTHFTSIIADFATFLTVTFSLIRVLESKKGNFHVIDMITLYYLNLFLLFAWFFQFLFLLWDFLWINQLYNFELFACLYIFLCLVLNFYATESQNMENLDKIEADL